MIIVTGILVKEADFLAQTVCVEQVKNLSVWPVSGGVGYAKKHISNSHVYIAHLYMCEIGQM